MSSLAGMTGKYKINLESKDGFKMQILIEKDF